MQKNKRVSALDSLPAAFLLFPHRQLPIGTMTLETKANADRAWLVGHYVFDQLKFSPNDCQP